MGVHIAIATPGRLNDFLEAGQVCCCVLSKILCICSFDSDMALLAEVACCVSSLGFRYLNFDCSLPRNLNELF